MQTQTDSFFSIPVGLHSVIGDERVDFYVIAQRNLSTWKSICIIVFGALLTAFPMVFLLDNIARVYSGKEAHYSIKGNDNIIGRTNFQAILLPAIYLVIFILIGLAILYWGYSLLFQNSGHFVGTYHRLIHLHNGNITLYEWNQFSRNMQINAEKGGISLQLRTGKVVRRKNLPDQFVRDKVHIWGVTDVVNIEKICRKRIKDIELSPN